jgi:hypothetical protein
VRVSRARPDFRCDRDVGRRTDRRRPHLRQSHDQHDAVIVGSECRITDIETNVSASTTTNEDGIYVIPNLRPATYRLTIAKEASVP